MSLRTPTTRRASSEGMLFKTTVAARPPLQKARRALPWPRREGELIQQSALFNVLIPSCPTSTVPTIISAAQTVRGAGRLARTRKGITFRAVIPIHAVAAPPAPCLGQHLCRAPLQNCQARGSPRSVALGSAADSPPVPRATRLPASPSAARGTRDRRTRLLQGRETANSTDRAGSWSGVANGTGKHAKNSASPRAGSPCLWLPPRPRTGVQPFPLLPTPETKQSIWEGRGRALQTWLDL